MANLPICLEAKPGKMSQTIFTEIQDHKVAIIFFPDGGLSIGIVSGRYVIDMVLTNVEDSVIVTELPQGDDQIRIELIGEPVNKYLRQLRELMNKVRSGSITMDKFSEDMTDFLVNNINNIVLDTTTMLHDKIEQLMKDLSLHGGETLE